jgi:UDP-glucose 4-epimerase
MDKKKILVTGGAGYIGSHTIVELLSNPAYEVISVDNFSNSFSSMYERMRKISGRDFVTYEVDLCDKEATRKVFEANPDIAGVIHFAAFKSVPESVADPLLYFHNNIASLVNILACLKEFNISNFIFSSSCSVYGNISSLPVNEDTTLNKAESPYAYSKQVGEVMIRDFSKTVPGINSIALRYFNPVGAHVSGELGELPINKPNNLVPVITQTAIGKIPQMTVFGEDYDTRDGTCIRDYIHVTDIADAHVRGLEYLFEKKNSSNYLILNLGSGSGVSVLEAIKMFEEISGVKLNYKLGPRRDGDVEAIYSDSSKAEQILGWKTKFDLRAMMETAWLWERNLAKVAEAAG